MLSALTPEQEAWLKDRVATGDFPSVEAAAQQLLDERIAERRHASADDKREVLLVGELSDIDLAEIAATEMAPHHHHLDGKLK